MSEHVKEVSSRDFNAAKPFSGIMKFVKVNIDEEPGLASLHGIQSIPTLILFRNGSELDRGVGGTEGIKMIENFVNANYVKK